MSLYDPVGDVCLQLQQGTSALQKYLVANFGVTNLGTFVCRPIRGSTTLSLHGEGRAGDNGGTPDAMRTVANLLVDHADQLGIQEVIYDRRIWRSNYVIPGWREFNGDDPHTGHVHWALNWPGAKTLTTDFIEQTIGGTMPLSDSDLEKIADIVDARIRAHIGFVGKNADGVNRKLTVVAACVHAIEAAILPEYRRDI